MDHTKALEVVVQHCPSENIKEFFTDSAVIFPFLWKRNFWMGLEGCLQVAWPSECSCKEQLPAAHGHPWSPIASSELLPATSPVIAIPAAVPSPFRLPSLSTTMFLLSAPFLPWRLATVSCNNFFIYRFYLSPPSSRCHCRQFPCVTASFKHHILMQDSETSISAWPLSPLCRLYIASYLNSQLFSWLNKTRTCYFKGIRALLESYIATLLFWSPFTSHLPTDKGPWVSLYMCEFTLLLGWNRFCDLC